MAKKGEAAAARAEKKENLKGDKKKFKNKNSIHKTKSKTTGQHNKFISRTRAVKKLQLTLKDFRKLCILKGIYPREPNKKLNSGAPTTYFFQKDITFLAHEPLLHKFREQKAFLKKVRRAVGRHEKKAAMRLDGRRPEYTLDHLIRERYPSFVDALTDLDDALSLVYLFASLSPSKYVSPTRIATCSRLAREFSAYLAHARSIRKVFVSIKGIYYQAEVHGVTLTWITPHSFAQQPTATVDYRVMLSFLELYEALLTLVNYKLYHSLDLQYPPKLDTEQDAAKGLVSSLQLEATPVAAPNPIVTSKAIQAEIAPPPSAGKLATLQRKLSKLEAEAISEDDATGVVPMEQKDDDDFSEDLPPDVAALRSLFDGLVFCCGRETPLSALELMILSCGGIFCWEDDGKNVSGITHHVIDRPMSDEAAAALAPRELIQPQWVSFSFTLFFALPPLLETPLL